MPDGELLTAGYVSVVYVLKQRIMILKGIETCRV
jgi:hypothetical protein